jgi:AcrR family transcriptional regulator
LVSSAILALLLTASQLTGGVSVATRTRLGPEARRDQLLHVGLDMVAAGEARTLEALTMEAVAARAGVSKALLFHYFPTKRDYRIAVAQAAADDLLARTEVPLDDDVLSGLRAGLDAFVDYLETHRDAYVGLVRGSVGGDPALQAVADATRDSITRRTLARMTELGMPTDPAATLAVRSWQALVEEAVLYWLDDRRLSRAALLDFLGQSFLAVVGSSQSDA